LFSGDLPEPANGVVCCQVVGDALAQSRSARLESLELLEAGLTAVSLRALLPEARQGAAADGDALCELQVSFAATGSVS
jgi:hypothetical protein